VRRDLIPSSSLPLAYFAFAHLGLFVATITLAIRPEIPGGFFYHPRMVALVHLVTLAWISSSILGAFYIVAPVALRLALPVRAMDWAAFAAFVLGVSGMVMNFATAAFDGVAWAASLVSLAMLRVAARAWRGLVTARSPWAVKLHVALAFANVTAAAGLGILVALDRTRGFLGILPLTAAYAHAHLAAVGWATMMVVGLAYRLIPMMLPALPPAGAAVALSAVLMQAGVGVIVFALLGRRPWLDFGAALITAGLVSFVWQVRRTLARRVTRPPSLPQRDWAVWQSHAALLWLLVAVVLGVIATTGLAGPRQVGLIWLYGTAGLVGFLAQMVVGIQGRIVPMYAWYRALVALEGAPPPRSVNALPSSRFAGPMFFIWAAGVPLLAWGFAAEERLAISLAAWLLACGLAINGAYLAYLLRSALTPLDQAPGAARFEGMTPPLERTIV
jgi:hypothetical protein